MQKIKGVPFQSTFYYPYFSTQNFLQMDKQHEKIMADFHRLLSTQKFETKKELEDFMNKMIGNKIPEFDKLSLSFQEQAQDLVFKAYELQPLDGRSNIAEALGLDPTCIEAYEYLAEQEMFPEIELIFLERAIEIGRGKFGDDFLKKNKGNFWLVHETRPFMRCLHSYSNCLNAMGLVAEAMEVLEEMIELNPNDNQGVRDQLLLYCISIEEPERFNHYAKMYKEDSMAFALFNRALFSFQTKFATKPSNEDLQKAIDSNKFVVPKLLSEKFCDGLADSYSPGSKEEADYYVSHAYEVWREIPGALDWLKKQISK